MKKRPLIFVSFLLFHRSAISWSWLAVVDGLTVVLDVVVVADVVVVDVVVVDVGVSVVNVVVPVVGVSVVNVAEPVLLVAKAVVGPELVSMLINR